MLREGTRSSVTFKHRRVAQKKGVYKVWGLYIFVTILQPH